MKRLLALLFFLPLPLRAAPLVVPDQACRCDQKIADPLEEPARFDFGKFRGQCIDSCRFRRARVLENGPEELVVGNILHLGRYVQARFRPSDVESVSMGFERFAPGVDHVLLKFRFKEKVELQSQDGRASPAGSTSMIAISSEGVPPKGTHYSLSDGYMGHYLLDHRVVTGEELDRWIGKLRHPFRLVQLKLKGPLVGKIFARGLRRSDAESFLSAYQLFANNCSTSALSLLDAETHFKSENWDPVHWEEFEAALPIAGPFGTEHALGYRGLTGP